MNLTLAGMKETSKWEAAGIKLPQYDVDAMIAKTKENPTWVHFGAGNIFRIFLGGVADDLLEAGLMETGITVVETFDEEIIEKMYEPFDNLVLSVMLKTDGSTDKRIVASLAEGIKADKDRLVEIFTNPSLQMASFTITEKGYALKDASGNFFPWIVGEVENGPDAAVSAMGVVTANLYQRYLVGGQPMAVVSMDNCAHNGDILKAAVTTMASEWQARGYVEAGFVAYLNDETKITFPMSMIDKITPRPAESIAEELAGLGITNMAPVLTEKRTFIAPFVNAEVPQYLVIEDKFPNGRPAFEKVAAGVYMTDKETVNKVEQMKVTTCLNPLHTALAVYGCLLGFTLIADEMKDPQLKKLVHQIGPVEGMPVVTDPGILSPQAFVEEVIHVRFPNPFMPDAPQRIATDTSQKVGIRFGETIKSYMKKDGDAQALKAIPLAIAGWCRYLLAVDDKGEAFELSDDPMLPELTALVADVKVGKASTYTGQLKPLLSNVNIFGVDLYEAGLGELIETLFVELIEGPGAVRATLLKYLG
ncbi:MAG: mannitol dehydrogenase family protein [Defluviitaleaceae bacterium]|nr:mannitol dehydrogenase family protein [Defluviitaleaceae bacterium]